MDEQLKNDAIAKITTSQNFASSKLKRDEIPAFPKFYKLFYTEAADKKPSLSERIKSFLGNGIPKKEIVKTLYHKFLKFEAFDQRMAATSERMHKNIGSVHTAMCSASETAKTYSHSLQHASSALDKDLNARSLKALTQHLQEKTADMQMTNAALEKRLDDASNDVRNLQETLEEIQRQSVTDALTDIKNRMYFDQSINQSIAQATRNNEPLCLVMLDIDHFKQFNDTYGHQTGDQVIRLVATTIQSTTRESDIACRYGGEEFVLILPNTDLLGASTLSNKVRMAIEQTEILKSSKNKNLGKITASFGIAMLNPGDTETTLIERADEALYLAKRQGRNRVRTQEDGDSDLSSAA